MMNWSLNPPAGEEGAAITVNTPSRDALLADIGARLGEGRGFTVATLNLDHVVKLRRDPAFRSAYVQHSHVVADGNPIVWLSRLAGQPTELAPGSELIEPVAEIAAKQRLPIALLGSSDAALARTAEVLSARYLGLEVVLRLAPPMGFDPEGSDADAAIAAIGAAGARVCFVALGAPKQEIFAIRAHAALPATGFLSVGAGLDFIAGTQKRAPGFVRAFAAEWLWRLATDPRRLAARYVACLALLPELTGAALASRRRSRI